MNLQKINEDMIRGESILPPGLIAPFGMEVAPTGWLVCDGSIIDSVTDDIFSDLFAAIGTTWGGSGAESFNLPDLRGEFLRGHDGGRGADPDANGRGIGSSQGHQFASHTHQQYQTNSYYDNGYNFTGGGRRYGWFGWHYNTSSSGGNETRPRNIAVQYCIKY